MLYKTNLVSFWINLHYLGDRWLLVRIDDRLVP